MKELITRLGDYKLEQEITEVTNRREFAREEYESFSEGGVPKMLENGKIYNVPDTKFAGLIWETIIGTNKSKVYKISLQIMDTDPTVINSIFSKVLGQFENEMGKFSEHKNTILEMYVWDRDEGNIILDKMSRSGMNAVTITLTSSSISSEVTEYVSKNGVPPIIEKIEGKKFNNSLARKIGNYALIVGLAVFVIFWQLFKTNFFIALFLGFIVSYLIIKFPPSFLKEKK